MATVETSMAGALTTFVMISGTAQQVLDALASRRQNKQTFIVHAMAYNGTNLSVLIEER